MKIRIVRYYLAKKVKGHPDWIMSFYGGYVDSKHNITVSTAFGSEWIVTLFHEIGHVFIDYLFLNLYHPNLFHTCWEVISYLLTPNFNVSLKSRVSSVKKTIKRYR